MSDNYVLSTILGNVIQIILLFTLQFYLCGRTKKWLGFVLPAYYFAISVHTLIRTLTAGLLLDYGMIYRIVIAFILPNITTGLLLLIYYFRKKD